MYGWMGTILRVDLSSGRIEKEPLTEELRYSYLGGRGINGRLLYQEVKPGTDGFAPENELIFGTGPLTGTAIAAGRFNVTAMSPLTGILGDSNGGSHFSPMLKYAGYDHIVVTGVSDHPVYLWIDDDVVELRDARGLWGKMTDDTREAIREELGDPRIEVSSIGPAGENLVRLASVVVGVGGACGKCGLGAVMGSKRLKAIAVRGTKGVKVADPDGFRSLVLRLRREMMEHKTYPRLSVYGTTYLYGGRNNIGSQAMRNGQRSGPFWGYDEISDETMHKNYDLKYKACHGCLNHCRSWFEIKDGPYAGLKDLRIELTIQESWGSLNDNSYAPSLFKGFVLCNQYGLDALECGQLIAAATEWHEMGLLTDKDLDGIDLRWGNHQAMIELTHKIARREGIGDLLAEDALRAAEKLGGGAEKCLTHCKGIVKTNADVRAMPVYAFGHVVSTRGADHLRGGALPNSGPPTKYEEVARTVFENNYIPTLADALELCKFTTSHSRMPLGVKEMAELVSVTTAMPVDEKAMRTIADRIWNLERAFIVREGITRKDDYLVGRYMDEPMNGGPWDGFAYDRRKWDEMLDEYYELAGWDKAMGVPTRATLESAGLKDVADELDRMGKLPA